MEILPCLWHNNRQGDVTVNFQEVLVECAMRKEFISSYNRLEGSRLCFDDNRKPIEILIDKATGYPYPFKNNPKEIQDFISFVFQFVWLPLILEKRSIAKEIL